MWFARRAIRPAGRLARDWEPDSGGGGTRQKAAGDRDDEPVYVTVSGTVLWVGLHRGRRSWCLRRPGRPSRSRRSLAKPPMGWQRCPRASLCRARPEIRAGWRRRWLPECPGLGRGEGLAGRCARTNPPGKRWASGCGAWATSCIVPQTAAMIKLWIVRRKNPPCCPRVLHFNPDGCRFQEDRSKVCPRQLAQSRILSLQANNSFPCYQSSRILTSKQCRIAEPRARGLPAGG